MGKSGSLDALGILSSAWYEYQQCGCSAGPMIGYPLCKKSAAKSTSVLKHRGWMLQRPWVEVIGDTWGFLCSFTDTVPVTSIPQWTGNAVPDTIKGSEWFISGIQELRMLIHCKASIQNVLPMFISLPINIY